MVRSRALKRSDFVRPEQGRVVAGVAAGLADTFGLNANVVRCGFVVLSVASGFGILLYGAAWALMPPADGDHERPLREDGADPISTLAFAVIVLGALLFVRAFGLWPGDVIVWPLAALVGLALLALHGPAGDTETADLPDWGVLQKLPPEAADAAAVLLGTRRGALARILAGGFCMLTGVIAFVATVDSWSTLRSALLATFAVVVGLALVIGPGVMRLAHAFVTERQERVRADERADVAAHLHDSVLQTLALVQRRADDPREVVRLARMQERELRAWLLGGAGSGSTAPAANTSSSLGAALEELAADVETETGVPVEVVRVRDCDVDGTEPLLLAGREAILNSARHSGAPAVSVYLEVEPDHATIFVRDRGKGFDVNAVPADRGGISYSITGRMERAGGKATIRSTVGDGTEVELQLPRVQKPVDQVEETG